MAEVARMELSHEHWMHSEAERTPTYCIYVHQHLSLFEKCEALPLFCHSGDYYDVGSGPHFSHALSCLLSPPCPGDKYKEDSMHGPSVTEMLLVQLLVCSSLHACNVTVSQEFFSLRQVSVYTVHNSQQIDLATKTAPNDLSLVILWHHCGGG